MHLTSHITHSNGYAPYIAYYRSNGFDQRFRKLKPKPKLNPPNAHRSQIKICEKRQTQNVQFRFMPNAFRILKPIQKSSKRVWVFRNTGANAFAKNQMRLAYEDKRDLYCTWAFNTESLGRNFFFLQFCFLFINNEIVYFRIDFRQILSSEPHNLSQSGPIYFIFPHVIHNQTRWVAK